MQTSLSAAEPLQQLFISIYVRYHVCWHRTTAAFVFSFSFVFVCLFILFRLYCYCIVMILLLVLLLLLRFAATTVFLVVVV